MFGPITIFFQFDLNCVPGHVHKYRHSCAFKRTQKKFFVNNFSLPELQTLKLFIQKEPILM